MKGIILIDPNKCVGCRNCALACSFVNEKELSLAKSRIWTTWIPNLGMNIPMSCQHCAKPLCMDVCPMGAITYNDQTGAVIIDSDRCIGCKMCVYVCPLGACILVESDKFSVVKCDLCNGDPECVKYCVYGALEYVEASELTSLKRRESIEKLAQALTIV
jgi:carbon-monoxide dehydrogenase iron sulfur subunit